MKTLIVYYSFTQNNKKLANYLQARLNCDTVEVETEKKRNGLSIFLDILFNRKPVVKKVSHDLRDYDHIIFLAPIWAGRIAMPLMSFALDQKSNIPEYSFITLCGGGNPNQKEKIHNELSTLLERPPLDVIELWVSKLPSAQKREASIISSVKVTENEIANYQGELENFLRELLLVSAI